MPGRNILIEVCIDSVESALAAQAGGAGRVELCDNLFEGGTTPSLGMMQVARRALNIDLHVIIRPRGGDFCYSGHEMEVMMIDIEAARSAGAQGVVIGALQPDGRIDRTQTAALIGRARPLRVTFHRAFDMTRDPFEALETLIDLGVERVLTSGQEATAWEGADLIAELAARAGDRMIIMPGGGITERNAAKIVARAGVREIHTGGALTVESRMAFRNMRIGMGRALSEPEYSRKITDAGRIQAIARALSQGHGAP